MASQSLPLASYSEGTEATFEGGPVTVTRVSEAESNAPNAWSHVSTTITCEPVDCIGAVAQAEADGEFVRTYKIIPIDLNDDDMEAWGNVMAYDKFRSTSTCHLGEYNLVWTTTTHRGWAQFATFPSRGLSTWSECNLNAPGGNGGGGGGGGGGPEWDCQEVPTDGLEISFDGGQTWEEVDDGTMVTVCEFREQ